MVRLDHDFRTIRRPQEVKSQEVREIHDPVTQRAVVTSFFGRVLATVQFVQICCNLWLLVQCGVMCGRPFSLL